MAAVLSTIQTQLREYDHDLHLDTPAATVQLDLLAGKCMKKHRLLSGDDIVRAMGELRNSKLRESSAPTVLSK